MGTQPVNKRRMGAAAEAEVKAIADVLLANVGQFGLIQVDYDGLGVKEQTFVAAVKRRIENAGEWAVESAADEAGKHLRVIPSAEKKIRRPRKPRNEGVPQPVTEAPADVVDVADDVDELDDSDSLVFE
jgi:hypothetical protein